MNKDLDEDVFNLAG